MVFSEKRLFERFFARFPAKIKDSRDSYGKSLYLRDFSAQGAQLISRENFFVNDSVSIDVEMPGSFPLTLKGVVVWSKKEDRTHWDLGLKFHTVNLLNLSRLYERVNPVYEILFY